ncbi:MAG: universal stress protein [Bacteroidetes bacterium]|jgi:nucleotide-binding universal stress UspA family protein|nr:universal stress protein [Bacteroidota bacterium]
MKVLIPLDFTPLTENAYHYALHLPFVKEIILFHVTTAENENAEADKKLKQISSNIEIPSHITVNLLVKSGNIYDLIGDTAAELNADLIVMATHGVKGWQRLVGSHAMKVITHSRTPYIVVQNKPYRPLKKILIPIDFTKEVKQVAPVAIRYAQLFNAEVILFEQLNKDSFVQHRITNNLNYFTSVLNDNNITFKIISKEFSLDDKCETVTREAVETDADIIVTTIDPNVGLTNFIMGVEEQKLLANVIQLPVLCVNIKHFTFPSDQFSISV